MPIKSKTSSKVLLTAALVAVLVGCGEHPSQGQNTSTGQGSDIGSVGSSILGDKKAKVTVIGKDPENLKAQKFGDTVLTDWSSPDGSFTMKLPSAARCTEQSRGANDLVVMCMAASPDVVSFFTYTYFDQGEQGNVENQVKVLQEHAKRNTEGDKSGNKSNTATYVADIQTKVINDTPVVQSINATGQNVFQTVSFFKGPFLISITTRPNPKSPKSLEFVKAITDSIVPAAGEHKFVQELQNAASPSTETKQEQETKK